MNRVLAPVPIAVEYNVRKNLFECQIETEHGILWQLIRRPKRDEKLIEARQFSDIVPDLDRCVRTHARHRAARTVGHANVASFVGEATAKLAAQRNCNSSVMMRLRGTPSARNCRDMSETNAFLPHSMTA